MKLFPNKLKEIHGYEEGKIDAVDSRSSGIAADYKKNFLKHFISINQYQIDYRLGGERYYVTRKYDGEYAIIFFDDPETIIINRSGRVRRKLPCIEEAGKRLSEAGIKEAIIPAELYVDDDKRRNRVNDLIATLAGKKSLSKLKLAAFDILEVDHQPFKAATYEMTIGKIKSFFAGGDKVHPVDMLVASSAEEVKNIFTEWVEGEGSEGLVVRSEMPFVYKIKPRHSIDAAVIGFTEGTGDLKGRVRTLLLALMPAEGKYQVVGRIGGGMIDSLKKATYKKFSSRIIDSDFIDTDSNHVAFHMIRPDTVVEFSVNDVIFETNNGPIFNPILEIEDNTYRLHSTVEGFSFIAPIFERFRDDKVADSADIRLSQIENFTYFNPVESKKEPVHLPKSELLLREVYKKELGTKIMVQKYMIWKTNKEKSGEFPAYVLYYTNFSSERAEPLQRDVTISDHYDQIRKLHKKALEKNLKKGWEKIE